METETFWDYIHKRAVAFRNLKRKEYLNGTLPEENKIFVEKWDCEPSKEIINLAYGLGTEPPKKMFSVDLLEEPLSIDIRIAVGEAKK